MELLNNSWRIEKSSVKQSRKIFLQLRRKSYTHNLRCKKPRPSTSVTLLPFREPRQRPRLNLKSKFLGPYKVTTVKSYGTYYVENIAPSDGPINNTICSEYGHGLTHINFFTDWPTSFWYIVSVGIATIFDVNDILWDVTLFQSYWRIYAMFRRTLTAFCFCLFSDCWICFASCHWGIYCCPDCRMLVSELRLRLEFNANCASIES